MEENRAIVKQSIFTTGEMDIYANFTITKVIFSNKGQAVEIVTAPDTHSSRLKFTMIYPKSNYQSLIMEDVYKRT